ncbi:MAG: DnaA regulatory inactivator Hda [Porticoccaceae bacterium]|nr:DnaA regulatory inactivator Hda [Pseudomonadales bacterium]MCP5173126.1 DnaA regulatory inactivator Hda [Pseudomonadales bacterium]
MANGLSGAEPQQLSLPVRLNDQATFDNFCCVESHLHQQIIELLKGGNVPLSERSVLLWGKPGSGVSHLLQAACQHARSRERQAQYLPLRDLLEFPPQPLFDNLEQLDLICLDDIQSLAGDTQWQQAVFDLYNRVRDSGGQLLMGAENPPNHLGLTLADLESRLGWGPVFQLPELDDDQKAIVIQFRAARRGMEFADEPVRYLITHSGRGMSELMSKLDTLEQLAIHEKRKLTIPFLKKTFGW